jgi:hypothetical protein
VLNSEIKIFDVKIKEGMNKLILDLFPKDSGHFVTVKFCNGISDFDFFGGKSITEKSLVNAHKLSGNHAFRKILNLINLIKLVEAFIVLL